MAKDLVCDKCGLGLTILDDVVGWSVVGINMTTTTNNNIGNIIIVVFDETRSYIYE